MSEPYRRLTLEWYRDEDGTRVVRVTVSGPLEGERTMLRALEDVADLYKELVGMGAIMAIVERFSEAIRKFEETSDREVRLSMLREIAEAVEEGNFEVLSTILTLIDVLAEQLDRRPSPQA